MNVVNCWACQYLKPNCVENDKNCIFFHRNIMIWVLNIYSCGSVADIFAIVFTFVSWHHPVGLSRLGTGKNDYSGLSLFLWVVHEDVFCNAFWRKLNQKVIVDIYIFSFRPCVCFSLRLAIIHFNSSCNMHLYAALNPKLPFVCSNANVYC